ncbi:MAG: oligosaccharide flippase family protein [Acidobacteriaceae bacterium]|nr:oligosaccharide flippase family protein [Acidobacteriaceae bacterium]
MSLRLRLVNRELNHGLYTSPGNQVNTVDRAYERVTARARTVASSDPYGSSALRSTPAYCSSVALGEEAVVGSSRKHSGDKVESFAPTSSRRVLFSNIVWMLVGNVAYGLSQWALLVTLAKIGNIEMVGNFALALAIVLPVLMFSSLSLRSLQITDHHGSYRFREYVSLRLLTLVLSLMFILGFGLLSGYSTRVLASTMLIASAKALEYVSDLLYGVLQRQENMSGIAISMALRALLSVATLGIGVFFTRSLVWGALGLLLASAIVLVAYDIPRTFTDRTGQIGSRLVQGLQDIRGLLSESGRQRRLSKLAVTGLPMGFVLMMVSLNINIPRYFIERHLGMAELGIFSAIATLMAAGGVVTNALGQAAAPRLAKYFAAHDRRGFSILLSAIVFASLGLGVLGFAGALLFGRQAMALIYRPEYSARQDVLIWLMGASGFFYLGSTLGYAVTAVRCFTPQLPLFAGAAVTTAIGCIVLVPRFGLCGAAIAILVSSLVQCAGGVRLLYTSFREMSAKPVVSCI